MKESMIKVWFPSEYRIMSMEMKSFRGVGKVLFDVVYESDAWTRWDGGAELEDATITVVECGKVRRVLLAECGLKCDGWVGDLQYYWSGKGAMRTESCDIASEFVGKIDGGFCPSKLVVHYRMAYDPINDDWKKLVTKVTYRGRKLEEEIEPQERDADASTYLFNRGRRLPFGLAWAEETRLCDERKKWERIARQVLEVQK